MNWSRLSGVQPLYGFGVIVLVSVSRFMPIAQTVNNIAAVIGGVVIFGQRVMHWHVYLGGVAMGLAGLFLLAQTKAGKPASRHL